VQFEATVTENGNAARARNGRVNVIEHLNAGPRNGTSR